MKRIIRVLLCLSVLSTIAWAVNSPVEYKQVPLSTELTKEDISSFIAQRNPKLDPIVRNYMANCIVRSSNTNNLKKSLVVGWIDTENTDWNPLAVSTKGAIGLAQIIPKYYKEEMKAKGITNNSIYHIDKNIDLGCSILKTNLKEFKTIDRALSGYNAGPAVTRLKGIAPYKETKAYIKRVLLVSKSLEPRRSI
jgi:soluble lytic murein transglycosylase-like protein